MSETDAEAAHDFEKDVERIVEEGREIRERVAARVAEAVTRIGGAFASLAQIGAATVQGALEGARGAPERERILKDVVDGLGDGVSRAALAARLACDEALGRGRSFATDDLERLRRELGGAGHQVAEAVGRTVGAAGDEVAEQADALRGHTKRAFETVAPAIRAAVDAARDDPKGLARDASHASTQAARQAAGALFAAIGGFLGRTGDRLRGE